jgi:translocation and assembly module TamB
VKRLLQVLALLCTLVVGTASIAVIVTQTVWFKQWLRGYIEREANQYLNGRLSIGRMGGNLFFGVELEDIQLTMHDESVVRVKDIGLDYNAIDFISGGLVLDDIRINGPILHLRKTDRGWNIASLIKRQETEAEREGPGRPVSIGSIGISDGTLVIDDTTGTSGVNVPQRIQSLDAKLAFEYQPVNFTVAVDHVSFRAADPAVGLNSFSGRISTRNDAVYFDNVSVRTEESSLHVNGDIQQYLKTPELNLSVSSEKLALDELARVVPAVRGIGLQPAFEVQASGPLDRLKLTVNARSSAGQIAGTVTADVTAPSRSVAGTVNLRHFDLAPLLRDAAARSDITGNADIALRMADAPEERPLAGLGGTYRVTAPRVVAFGYDVRDVKASGRFDGGRVYVNGGGAAYGGHATAVGWIAPGTPLQLDLRGQATHFDLRNLPRSLDVPAVPSDITATYHIEGSTGTRADLRVDGTFRESRFAGATISSGSTGILTLNGSQIGYAANATMGTLDLQQVGRGLGIDALSADRFRSNLNGTVSAEGSGTSLQTLALAARGTLVDSSLFGGDVPRLSFDAALRDQGLKVTANGAFGGFDPAVLSGNERMKGTLAGTLDLTASVARLGAPLTPDAVSATGQVQLASSRVADIVIDEATVAGTYANSTGDIRTLDVKGPDFAVNAKGHLDLTDRGRTDVGYTVGVSNLEPVARMTGQPIAGGVAAEGRLTGNLVALATEGTLRVTNLKYGENGVLAATTTYAVRIPDLQVTRAEVTADTTASLVRVAGRDLTEVQAKTTWRDQTLGFDTSLRDQARTVAVAGDVVLHPDHQEVHLRDAALRTQGVEWRTAPGSAAAVQYGAERISVQQLHLVSANNQDVTIEGALGRADDRLVVRASNIDLATVDHLAMANKGIGGQFNATATISGTRTAPRAEAQFAISNGAVREFRYNAFGGTILYGPDGLRLDTRLTQAPDAWVTVKGFVPPDAFQPSAAAAAPAEGHIEATSGHALDVAVQSSALNLAIVQGFVPQVSKASGTVQANLRIGGAVSDPHVSGSVDIRNGAFTVADLTKGGYTGLDTRIAFEPDRVRINQFRLLDEHQHPLTVSGELQVHQRAVGGVQIAIKSDEFEVIDNELADIKLNTDLRVNGEFRAPRVEGDLFVHAGTINVDRVLDMVTNNAYAVEPTSITSSVPATPGAPNPTAGASTASGVPAVLPTSGAPQASAVAAPTEAEGFQAVGIDVRLRLPSNLVIKGQDINPTGSSPIGLGNLNVTVAGDVRAMKRPGDTTVRLRGNIQTVRGTYQFQGRRFDIQRDGQIQFTGGDQIDPRLDLRATRLISGVEATVRVQGTARQPKLSLSSQPPLEEADILSLIIFNQPVNSLGEGEQVSLAQRAGALASGFVASSLAQSLGNALELDVFEVQTAPETGQSASVTVGEQVGERLFVKFRQAFGAQSVSQFIVEYQIADYLRLQTSVAQGGEASQHTLMQRVEQGGLDLIFYFTY